MINTSNLQQQTQTAATTIVNDHYRELQIMQIICHKVVKFDTTRMLVNLCSVKSNCRSGLTLDIKVLVIHTPLTTSK